MRRRSADEADEEKKADEKKADEKNGAQMSIRSSNQARNSRNTK